MPSRLQLAELEKLIAAGNALSFMAESAGARPIHTLRNAIQLQCKTFLEDMHTHSLTQLTGQLSQLRRRHPALLCISCTLCGETETVCSQQPSVQPVWTL